MTTIYNIFAAAKILLLTMWLSISSVDFYQDVYKRYIGYGIKYVFTISFISSLVFGAFLLLFMVDIEDYLVDNVTSKSTISIDYVIKQLPNIAYNGETISIEEELPFYLTNINGAKLVAIDLNNQLNYTERQKIPIILTANKLILSLIETTDKSRNDMTISYKQVFGNEARLFTQDNIKKYLGDMSGSFIKMFIYIGMPLLVVLRFITVLLEKSFIVILLYFLTNTLGPKMPLQTSIRLVMFSSGVAILLQPIIILTIPTWSGMIWIIQMWSNLLLVLAILKVRNNAI